MALEPENREDLLKEATAFSKRIMFHLDAQAEDAVRTAGSSQVDEVFLGFKEDGSYGVFLGQTHVLQFTPAGLLRRLFVDGRKFAANKRGLVELMKTDAGGRMSFQRQQVEEEAELQLLAQCQELVRKLLPHLGSTKVQAEPDEEIKELQCLAIDKLETIGQTIEIANSL